MRVDDPCACSRTAWMERSSRHLPRAGGVEGLGEGEFRVGRGGGAHTRGGGDGLRRRGDLRERRAEGRGRVSGKDRLVSRKERVAGAFRVGIAGVGIGARRRGAPGAREGAGWARRGRCRRRWCRRPTWAPRRAPPWAGWEAEWGAPRPPPRRSCCTAFGPTGPRRRGRGRGAAARGRRRGLGTVAAGRGLTRFTVRPGILAAWGSGGAGEEVGTVSARSRVAGSPRWGKASVAPREGERCRDRGASAHLAYRRACRRAYPLLCLCVRRVPTGGRAPWARASADWSGKARGGMSERAGNATSPGVRETRDRIAERRYADARGPSIASRPERTSFFFFPPLVTTANFSTAIEEGEGGGASEGGGDRSAPVGARKNRSDARHLVARRAFSRVGVP